MATNIEPIPLYSSSCNDKVQNIVTKLKGVIDMNRYSSSPRIVFEYILFNIQNRMMMVMIIQ